jgi:hypothetical protein
LLLDVEGRLGSGNGLRAGFAGAVGVVAAAELREEDAALLEPANPLVPMLERSPKLGRPPKFLLDGRLVEGEVAELDPVAEEPNAVDDTDGAAVEPDRAD